mmetsp:Transcript_9430/g.22701  ORF Transcript_9430/g.22701 Transcript_9430/m.22701 type:complete len:873 (-) Transcript_9430:70-2688(-)
MSADPVILDVLASICKDALQLFERIQIVFDDKEERRANICISRHFIYFVNREMSRLIEGRERISYLDIERAVVDSSSNRYFLLELRPSNGSSWSGSRILVQSTHRELLLQKIALCWQAEVMYRLFEVKKFDMVKAALGEQLAAVKTAIAKQNDLIKIEPFRGYDDSFNYRGYSFWLRKGFASVSGLRDGVYQNDEGWEVSYKAQPVVVPPGVRVMVQVDNEHLIMDLQKSREGMEDLRTVAMEYQRSLTENLDQFYVVVSGQYLKKMNRTDDVASWDGWEFFVRSKEYAFACVLFRRQYIPPLFSTCQDIVVVIRCPAQNMTNDSCEVILDECHLVADSIASVYENVGIYKRPVQARLDTLHFSEEGYRWCEGQLGMVPVHRRAALKFLKSLVKMLVGESALWDESIENDEIFREVPVNADPCAVPQEPISEAQSLLQNSSDRLERRNAWAARIARYFAYCVDGGIMGERFTLPLLIQSMGRVSSDVDQQMKNVIDFLLHVNERDDWKTNLFLEGKVISLIALTKESEQFSQFKFNDIIMRHLLSEGYVETELKKRLPGTGVDYADLLAQLLTDETVGLGLRTMVCRHVLDMLGGTHDREEDKFEKTVRQLVPALVKVMNGNNHILRSYATASLVNLSCGRQNMKQLLVSQGVLSMCVKQLKTKHDELTLYTLFLLVNLTKTPHHRYIVVREGGIPLLVDILTSSYQNLRKQRILAEVCSVFGQLCNEPETRSLISESFPVVPCLLWVNDAAQPNTKLKSKLLFALRQLCLLGQNKLKVGPHIIPVLLEELALANWSNEECATNLVLLLVSLASVNSNALMMQEQINASLETCGILKDGMLAKNSRLANHLGPKVEGLLIRINDASAAQGDF